MKNLIRFSLGILMLSIWACSGGGNDDANETITSNLGSFDGSLQVTDDPQTNLGFIFNTRAEITRVGDNVRININGDFGFNRVYEAKIDVETESTFLISFERQVNPEEKIAGGTIAITNNDATITIMLADDMVMLKKRVSDSETFELGGKLRLSGSFLKN